MAAADDNGRDERRRRITRRTALALLATGGLAIAAGKAVDSLGEILAPVFEPPDGGSGQHGRSVDHLTVHHTASPAVVNGRQVNAALLAEWHRERGIGFGAGDERDCAYHFVVLPDGRVETGRPLERRSGGTRSLDLNARSVDVVLVGDFDPEHNGGRFEPASPTSDQLRALDRIALWSAREYEFPAADVLGHREALPGTACPGRRLDMEAVRARLAAALSEGKRAGSPV